MSDVPDLMQALKDSVDRARARRQERTMADDPYDEGYWEHGVGSNYHGYGDDPGWDPTARLLRRLVPERGSLLDVGCAKGYFVAAALRAGFDARGIDLSRWAVDHPAPGVATRIRRGDVTERLPWPDEAFNVVVSWELLEHIDADKVLDVLAEMVRVAKPGALLLNRIALAGSDQAEHDVDHTHVTMWERPAWEAMLARLPVDRAPWIDERLDQTFAGRDWSGRFFAAIVR